MTSISGRPGAARSGQSDLNNIVAVVLLLFVLLAPVPLGGNHPLAWLATAAFIGIVGLLYCLILNWSGQRFRFAGNRLLVETCLYAAVLFYLLVQTVPLPEAIRPLLAADLPGELPSPQTISLAPKATALMLVCFLAFGLLFFLLLQISTNRTRAYQLLRALLAIAAVHAAWGLFSLVQFGDTLLGLPKWAYPGSATGTFVNRNSFATLLAMGLAIGCALLFGALRGGRKASGSGLPGAQTLLALAAVVVIGAALIATQSRMGVASGAIGAVFIVLLALAKSSVSPGVKTIAAVLALAAAAGLGVLYGPGLLERVGSVEQAVDVRAAFYGQVLEMIRQRPWLGYGGGSFELAYPLFHRPPVSVDLSWTKAHSTYLALWSELGLVFGSLPIIVMALLGVRLFRAFLRAETSWIIPLAAMGALLAAAIHSTVDFSLEIQANAYFVIAVTAVAVGSTQAAGESK